MTKQFLLTPDHIKLIGSMYWDWDDSAYDGAPAVNIKRPYGNSGDQAYQVYEVLNGEYWDLDERGDMPDELHDALMKLHRETLTAIEVVISAAIRSEVARPGIYVNVAQQYHRPKWRWDAELPTRRYFARLSGGPVVEITRAEYEGSLSSPGKQVVRESDGWITAFTTLDGKLEFWRD